MSGPDDRGAPDVQLYFFTNHGCAPCRQVEPGIVALSEEGYPVTTIVVSEQPQIADRFGVTATPTVIMMSDKKMVGRHAGLIDGVTLKKWFAAVGVLAGSKFSDHPGGTKVSLDASRGATRPHARSGPLSRPHALSRPIGDSLTHSATVRPSAGSSASLSKSFAGSSTLHKGTRRPKNPAERQALSATVRLKVEDSEGISYATGTVVHCHQGEWLVMTCGHVFRESKGNGKITAEYSFEDGTVKTAAGQLISYDAEARDIGLVAIQAGVAIEPVQIALINGRVETGESVFSIGCDRGDAPTIRRSQIKNRAAYDGAVKYDIFGRPVNGRSGGGLFNGSGELIGVCNAAAVEVDEGIYTALETLHWQIAEVKLQHLFESRPSTPSRPASSLASVALASHESPVAPHRGHLQPIRRPDRFQRPGVSASRGLDRSGPGRREFASVTPDQPLSRIPTRHTPVAWDNSRSDVPRTSSPSAPKAARSGDASDSEVIIIVRSKSDPNRADTITVSHPSRQLLDYLGQMQTHASEPRHLNMARLREPELTR